eukprot:4644770-Pyramimonas_sp.AAC.1
MFGQQPTEFRRRLGASCASAPKGRCLTKLLDLRASGMDPAVSMATRTVDLWLSMWQSHPSLRT